MRTVFATFYFTPKVKVISQLKLSEFSGLPELRLKGLHQGCYERAADHYFDFRGQGQWGKLANTERVQRIADIEIRGNLSLRT